VIIYTDASGVGIGAVLKQPQDDGVLHPVAYFSRKSRPAEMKKKAVYLECLAIKEALVFWQYWLIGRDFNVISDHKPLETMRVRARTDEALGDLMNYLAQYNFKIIYAQGKENVEAGSLSRNPVLESFENQDEVLTLVNFVMMRDIEKDQKTNREEIFQAKSITERQNIYFKKLKQRDCIFISGDLEGK